VRIGYGGRLHGRVGELPLVLVDPDVVLLLDALCQFEMATGGSGLFDEFPPCSVPFTAKHALGCRTYAFCDKRVSLLCGQLQFLHLGSLHFRVNFGFVSFLSVDFVDHFDFLSRIVEGILEI